MNRTRVVYDKVGDILYIGEKMNNLNNVEVEFSSGHAVLEVGADGMIRGIEIMNASSVLDIASMDLESVDKGFFNALHTPSYTSISLNLFVGEKTITTTIDIPYSEKLSSA